ncbi:hypothetical protein C8Q73DRAFT_539011 [Cubamyces lactineus]|nr:hypothetical protein C8Q73DRAFT_539011 [Cubamyces lactineus]
MLPSVVVVVAVVVVCHLRPFFVCLRSWTVLPRVCPLCLRHAPLPVPVPVPVLVSVYVVPGPTFPLSAFRAYPAPSDCCPSFCCSLVVCRPSRVRVRPCASYIQSHITHTPPPCPLVSLSVSASCLLPPCSSSSAATLATFVPLFVRRIFSPAFAPSPSSSPSLSDSSAHFLCLSQPRPYTFPHFALRTLRFALCTLHTSHIRAALRAAQSGGSPGQLCELWVFGLASAVVRSVGRLLLPFPLFALCSAFSDDCLTQPHPTPVFPSPAVLSYTGLRPFTLGSSAYRRARSCSGLGPSTPTHTSERHCLNRLQHGGRTRTEDSPAFGSAAPSSTYTPTQPQPTSCCSPLPLPLLTKIDL